MQASSSFSNQEGWTDNKGPFLPNNYTQHNKPVICNNCGYINHAAYKFCTNCGHPLQVTSERLAQYKFKIFKRKQQLKKSRKTIKKARNTLYTMALMILLGVGFIVPVYKQNFLRAFVLVLIAAIYFTLARWSVSKPFTSFLIGFLMLLSFMAINTWAEFTRLFTSGTGLYLLVVQTVLCYFLYHGVRAAYQADQIEEAEKL